jgi:hypothetical protein
MNDKILTFSTSKDTMGMEPIVLRETKTTRLLFEPIWVDVSKNPLRGGFRFQRKSPNDMWQDFESKSLGSLHKDEEYKLNLHPEEIYKLLSKLGEINSALKKHGHAFGDRVILLNKDNAEGIFLQIGQLKNREWVIEQLRALESENFESLGSAIGRARLENVIKKFEENIDNNDEKFWEEFFDKNPWVLQQVFAYPVIYLNGETYLGGKNSKGRQGSGGSATDFLFKNGSNGSFAVVEIKTPSCGLIGTCYRGKEDSDNKNEVYSMHSDLTGRVVQMENQIHIAVEYFKTTIGDDYVDINHLNPAGVLIAGNYSKLSSIEQKSFDLFRKSLGKNQVYTFDEVLAKLKLLKTVYEK